MPRATPRVSRAAQKRLDLGTRRCPKDAPIARAFERGGGGRKAHRRALGLAPSASINVKAPWNVSPAPSVSTTSTLNAGNLPQLAVLEPQHIVRAIGHGDERRGLLADVDQRAAEMVGAGGCAQSFCRKHHVRHERKQHRCCRGAARRRRARSECRACAPPLQTSRTNAGKAIVRDHGVGVRDERVGIARPRFSHSARRGSSRSRARRDRRWRSPRSVRGRRSTRGQSMTVDASRAATTSASCRRPCRCRPVRRAAPRSSRARRDARSRPRRSPRCRRSTVRNSLACVFTSGRGNVATRNTMSSTAMPVHRTCLRACSAKTPSPSSTQARMM